MLSEDICTIFNINEDRDVRIESTPFSLDLNYDGKTTKLMFSLVVGVGTQCRYTAPKQTHLCNNPHCMNEDFTWQPTLLIRNLRDENIDLAKITVTRNVLCQERNQMTKFRSDSVEHKMTFKRHEQKVFESYKDLTSCQHRYPGSHVTFEFKLNFAVYKVVTK